MRQPHWPLSADRSDLGVGDTARGSAGDSTPTWLLQIGGLRPPTPLWAQRKRSSFLQPTASCAAFVGVRASWNRTEAAGPLPHAALRGTHRTYVLSPGQAAWCSGVPVVSGSASKLVAQMSDRSTRCHLRVLSQRPAGPPGRSCASLSSMGAPSACDPAAHMGSEGRVGCPEVQHQLLPSQTLPGAPSYSHLHFILLESRLASQGTVLRE